MGAWTLAGQELSLDAARTGRVGSRGLPEMRDVVPAVLQLGGEGRRVRSVGDQVDVASRPGERDVEEAPLLGIAVRFRIGEDEVQQGIVDDLGGEAVPAAGEAEQDDVVGLEALGGVNGLEADPERGVTALQGLVAGEDAAVARENEDGRGAFAVPGVLGDAVEGLVDEGRARLGREAEVDARAVGLAGRSHGLGDLRRVLEDEPGSGFGETVGATEGGLEAELLVVAEMLAELPHDRDVGAGVARDGLPVVSDREQAVAGGLPDQGLHETGARRRDVLEFVDEDVSVGAPVLAAFDVGGGAVDHVVEIDEASFVEGGLVGLVDRLEDLEEGLAAFPSPGLLDSSRESGVGQPGALEVVQEGGDEADEGGDPVLFFEDVEDLSGRDRIGFDVMFHKRGGEGALQCSVPMLVAEGLYEDGAAVGVELAFPRTVGEVAVPIDEWRGATLHVDDEMLDIDVAVRDLEIRPVLPAAAAGGVVLVGSFVFVGDAVQEKEVGDLAFFEASDLLALQGSQVVLADIGVVLARIGELVLALVRGVPVLQPGKQGPGVLGVGDQVGDDFLEEALEGIGIVGGVGDAGFAAFDVSHDRHAEGVERLDGEALAGVFAHAGGEAVLHLVAGVAGECEEQ